jgi:glucokinase
MAKRYAVGVDFGGTKVLASVVDVSSGQELSVAKRQSNASDSADELVERIYGTIDESLDEVKKSVRKSVTGIGIGIAGQVDSQRGVLLAAPNLSQATVDLPLADLMSERYKVPAALLNDVQIAALGEARFGAGVGCDDFLCVFVGTGVGGAIVRRGDLVRGATGSAGEIGHVIVDANGRYCGCGGRGHLEAYASRTAITAVLVEEVRRGFPSALTKLAPEIGESSEGGVAIRSGVIARAIRADDELVIETIREAGEYLGLGLASAINLLNPARVILGGGVIEAVDLLFDVAARRARRESLAIPGKAVEIVKAMLGDSSGVVGAAILGDEAAKAS